MKITVIKCDNPTCKYTSENGSKVNMFSLNDRDFDLCPACAEILIKKISDGSVFLHNNKVEPKEVKSNIVSNEKFEPTSKDLVTKADYSEKTDTSRKISHNRSVSNDKYNYEIIDQYGREIVIKMYTQEGMSAKDIAELVGVPKTSIQEYFRKLKVYKYGPNKKHEKKEDTISHDAEISVVKSGIVESNNVSDKDTKSNEETVKSEKKIITAPIIKDKATVLDDVESLGQHISTVKFLRGLEKAVTVCYAKCKDCVYKNNKCNRCYYTMVTNKENNIKNNICYHHIDKEQAKKYF